MLKRTNCLPWWLNHSWTFWRPGNWRRCFQKETWNILILLCWLRVNQNAWQTFLEHSPAVSSLVMHVDIWCFKIARRLLKLYVVFFKHPHICWAVWYTTIYSNFEALAAVDKQLSFGRISHANSAKNTLWSAVCWWRRRCFFCSTNGFNFGFHFIVCTLQGTNISDYPFPKAVLKLIFLFPIWCCMLILFYCMLHAHSWYSYRWFIDSIII